MSAEDEQAINDSRVAEEQTIVENIRNLSGDELKKSDVRKLRDSFLGKSRWAFMLPAGDKTGSGGLTANCFNLRFGPFALRVITKSLHDLQLQLYRLSEMMNYPEFEELRATQETWQREADALNQVCKQLCGIDIESGGIKIKAWRSPRDVKLLPAVLPHLNKVWIYAGRGEDIIKDRIYIRDKLNAWVEGNIPSAGGSESATSACGDNLQAALEAFDIWLPCSMLDEYCCLSDIPGADYVEIICGYVQLQY
jgi:hypothetical protein